jgi:hypothetical protein
MGRRRSTGDPCHDAETAGEHLAHNRERVYRDNLSAPDPNDGRKTLAQVTDAVRKRGNRRRIRGADAALAAALPKAVTARERATLLRALNRMHQLLVTNDG